MNRSDADALDRLERCVKCGIDITDFLPEELSAHAKFHSIMADAPKSIPSQGPFRRLEDFPKYDVSGWLWR